MSIISKQYYTSYIKTIYKIMRCKSETSKERILKTIMTDFSYKEKTITRS